MAITVVAATTLRSTSGTSVSVSVSATAGNALLVGGGSAGGSTWTVTRTGDTYTTDTSGANSGSLTGIASAPNVAGGSVSMTIASTGANGLEGWAVEVSGLPSSGIRDATSPALTNGTTTSVSSNSLTNVTADAIFICAYVDDNSNATDTITPGTGWTNVVGGTTMAETNGTALFWGGNEYQIVSSVAAVTGTWTETPNSGHWTCAIAVYKAAPSGYSPPAVFPGVFNLDARRMI